MKSYMEMIRIGGDNHAYKTGVGAMMESDGETWRAFLSAKRMAVPVETASFLLDYYNRKGDLADSIPLDDAGYARITGEAVLSDAEYQAFDREFWAKEKLALRKRRGIAA